MPLKTIAVGNYTVSQMGPLESARLRLFQRKIEPLITDDEAMNETLNEWALVAACTTPLIERDAYLQMPLSETQLIVKAVEDLNGDLIGDGESDTKKKKP